MPPTIRDHKYTVRVAEGALERIKALQLPGDPPSFELWYTYVGRYIPALNQAINEALTGNGTLNKIDADRIYDQYLGSFHIGEQVERIGLKFRTEIEQTVGTIDAAIASSARHRDQLTGLTRQLDDPSDPAAIRALIEAVVSETHSAVAENESYRLKLQAARCEIEDMRGDLEAVRRETNTDPLTALANRKQFDRTLNEAIGHAADAASPLGLLMFDVDHFKQFNDTWGHPVGDDVLRLIARVMKETTRVGDVAARYGGEEFAIILPNTTLAEAARIGERLRATISTMEVVQRSTNTNLGPVTISIGVAEWQAGETAREFLERTDALLYAAKRQGRNRLVSADDQGASPVPVRDGRSRGRLTQR
jgi:diguanylate cyclase